MDYNRLGAATSGRINTEEDGKFIYCIKKSMHLPNYKFYSIHSDVDSIYDDDYQPEESFCRRYGGMLALTIVCFLLFVLLLYGALYRPRIYA